MQMVLDVLDWAKNKDLAEIVYEDRSGPVPVLLNLAFDAVPAQTPASKFLSIQSPCIGKVLLAEKVKKGAAVAQGELLGYIENGSGKQEVKSSAGGKIVEVEAASGSGVGYGQTLLVLEIVF